MKSVTAEWRLAKETLLAHFARVDAYCLACSSSIKDECGQEVHWAYLKLGEFTLRFAESYCCFDNGLSFQCHARKGDRSAMKVEHNWPLTLSVVRKLCVAMEGVTELMVRHTMEKSLVS